MFADAFYNFSSQKNGAFTSSLGGSHPFHRAYARNNGFSLSFLGTDIVYDTEHFGATASLRFGPSVPIFYGTADNDQFGIENLVQAFVTWKPTDKLSIDFGQFGTIYGAEVAESWRNLNYTRGGLYYAMQPFWHTGLRAKLAVSDQLTLTGMVVNGVNNIVDSGDELPSIGLQGAYATDGVGVVLGYLGSMDPEADFFDHFIDLVVTSSIGSLNLVFNGDFGMDTKRTDDMGADLDDATWYGASLALGTSFTEEFGAAIRGEYLGDPDGLLYGAEDGSVITATLTFDYRPAGSQNLIIRWDNRYEVASEQIYVDRDEAPTDSWFQSVLGVVVTSN